MPSGPLGAGTKLAFLPGPGEVCGAVPQTAPARVLNCCYVCGC